MRSMHLALIGLVAAALLAAPALGQEESQLPTFADAVAAVESAAGLDLSGVGPDTEITVVPISELELSEGTDQEALAAAREANAEAMSDVRDMVADNQLLVDTLDEAGFTPSDVVGVSMTETEAVMVFVRTL